ncbi:hypothetical protein EDB83DRAFT_2405709 [Lactarius deliciosus]|nr:hypothetical protein EDB83DRAFT_2405709 [Lactarius deliciosus]
MLSTAWSNLSPLVRRRAQPFSLSLWEEYPKLTVLALHPGYIKTQLSTERDDSNTIVFDIVQLPAATMLYLAPGCIDRSNGKSARHFPGLSHCFQSDQCQILSSKWDLEGVERDWKEKVQVMNALVNKLAIPK